MSVGGWIACGEGRRMAKGGAVTGVSLSGNILKGMVKFGARDRVAGLNILGPTNIENLCQCAESRRSGAICSHSMAVGYAWLQPKDAPRNSPAALLSEERDASSQILPRNADADTGVILPPGFEVRFDASFLRVFRKGKIPVRLTSPVGEAGRVWASPLGNWLKARGVTQFPALAVIPAIEGGGFFRLLQGHENVWLGEKLLSISTVPVRLAVALEPALDGVRVRLSGLQQPGADEGELGNHLLDFPDGVRLYDGDRSVIWPLVEMPGAVLEKIAPLLHGQETSVELDFAWLAVWAGGFGECFALSDPASAALMPSIRVGKPEIAVECEGSLNHVALRVKVSYCDGPTFYLGQVDLPEPGFPYLGKRHGEFLTRDAETEGRLCDLLEELGFQSSQKDRSWQQSGEKGIMRWFLHGVSRLGDVGATLVAGERWSRVTENWVAIRPMVCWGEVSEKGRHFRVEASGGHAANEVFSWETLLRLKSTGRLKVDLPAGKLGLVDGDTILDLEEVLHDCRVRQNGQGNFFVPAAFRALLEQWTDQWTGDTRGEKLEELEGGEWWSRLHPYQKSGVGWLVESLRTNARGAILADEMGLGKTLQSLMALKLLVLSGHLPPPTLVVCPTSLVENWRSEIVRFLPEALIWTPDSGKEIEHSLAGCLNSGSGLMPRILILSFGMLARHEALFKGKEFGLVLVDEASHMRNPKTRLAQALRGLRSVSRLALSGTPIENRLLDLWSILDFSIPGYLGSFSEFRERYEKPLNKGNDRPLWRRFRRMLKPVILRRTKKEVAADLPSLVERVVSCRLTTRQKALYDEIADTARKEIISLEKTDLQKPIELRARMLTALLRLRQICCDARLLGHSGQADLDAQTASAKLALLKEILPTLIDDGHRVLVFSQFVGALKLIRSELEEVGIKYEYLDGSSTNRGEIVQRFQKGQSPVFLLSLKAGGYGLNLPQADQVIHYDPWWNPAVEAQATDRAHRFGQIRPVTSHKFIVSGTVEEKILKLQATKRLVFESAMDDQQPMMNGLSLEELRDLLGVS